MKKQDKTNSKVLFPSIPLDEAAMSEQSPLLEMGMSASKLSDKYGEVVSSIVENMVCICLYPYCPTIVHWKDRVIGLCKRFVNTNIANGNNTPPYRLKVLMEGVVETLDDDYGALINYFKNVSGYYATKEEKHERLTPYKPYTICYEENKDRVINGIKNITSFVAEQDLTKISKYMHTF